MFMFPESLFYFFTLEDGRDLFSWAFPLLPLLRSLPHSLLPKSPPLKDWLLEPLGDGAGADLGLDLLRGLMRSEREIGIVSRFSYLSSRSLYLFVIVRLVVASHSALAFCRTSVALTLSKLSWVKTVAVPLKALAVFLLALAVSSKYFVVNSIVSLAWLMRNL